MSIDHIMLKSESNVFVTFSVDGTEYSMIIHHERTHEENNCEAQGKGRARGGPRKVTQRSFIDGGWWMVDILSLMLYTKFGCHPPYSRLLNRTFKNPPPQF